MRREDYEERQEGIWKEHAVSSFMALHDIRLWRLMQSIKTSDKEAGNTVDI
jgi:hypothetical protein